MGLPIVSPSRKHLAGLNEHYFLECSPSSAGREIFLPYKEEHKEAVLKQHMVWLTKAFLKGRINYISYRSIIYSVYTINKALWLISCGTDSWSRIWLANKQNTQSAATVVNSLHFHITFHTELSWTDLSLTQSSGLDFYIFGVCLGFIENHNMLIWNGLAFPHL